MVRYNGHFSSFWSLWTSSWSSAFSSSLVVTYVLFLCGVYRSLGSHLWWWTVTSYLWHTCFINYAPCDDFITYLSCVAANKIQLQQMLTMLHGNVVALLRHPHASPGLWLLCSCISNLHSGEWVCERVPVVLVLMEYGQRTQWMSSVTFYYCNRS